MPQVVSWDPKIDAWRPHSDMIIKLNMAGRLTIVAGSGVSQFAPSSVPVASDISRRIRRLLIRRLPFPLRVEILRSTERMPFEVLLGRVRELDDNWANAIVSTLVSTCACNDLHRIIVGYLRDAAEGGTSSAIITTNYDQGLHLAAAEIGLRVSEIISGRENAQVDRPEIMYLHGYVERPETMVLDFREEFALSRARIQHVRRLVAGRVLLLVGFSGGDLDVADALASARPAGIYWIRQSLQSADISRWPSSARRLMAAVPTSAAVVLVSNGGLSELLHPAPGFVPFTIDRLGLNGRIRDALTCPPPGSTASFAWRELWAGWLGLRAGYGRLGPYTAKRVAGRLPAEKRLEIESFGAYYRGQYHQAAALQRRAAELALARGRQGRIYTTVFLKLSF